MKRNKSGNITESFEVEIDSLFGSFIVEYTVLAYKQDADHRCVDSDYDYLGYTEINSVNMDSLLMYNEETGDYKDIQIESLLPSVQEELNIAVWEDAANKINEGIKG